MPPLRPAPDRRVLGSPVIHSEIPLEDLWEGFRRPGVALELGSYDLAIVVAAARELTFALDRRAASRHDPHPLYRHPRTWRRISEMAEGKPILETLRERAEEAERDARSWIRAEGDAAPGSLDVVRAQVLSRDAALHHTVALAACGILEALENISEQIADPENVGSIAASRRLLDPDRAFREGGS